MTRMRIEFDTAPERVDQVEYMVADFNKDHELTYCDVEGNDLTVYSTSLVQCSALREPTESDYPSDTLTYDEDSNAVPSDH